MQRRVLDLIDELLVAFATAAPEYMDAAIDTGLRDAASIVGADGAYLWEAWADGDQGWMPHGLLQGNDIPLHGATQCPHSIRRKLESHGQVEHGVVVTPLLGHEGVLGAVFWVSQHPLSPDASIDLDVIGHTFAHALRHKRDEGALQQNQRLRAAVLTSLAAGIVVLDRDGTILEVNEAWKRLGSDCGVRNVEAILPGSSYRQACAEIVVAGFPGTPQRLADIEGVCSGRIHEFEIEYRIERSPAERWFAMRVSPLRRDEGGAVVIHRDISQHKRAQRVLHTFSGRLIAAQEGERRRIARELHDDIGQRVSLLAIEIDQTAMESTNGTGERLRALGERTAELATEIHRLAHGLHSTKLDALGLVSAGRGHCREVLAAGLEVTFSEDNVTASVPADVKLCVFRVVQEALTNTLRYGGVTKADVRLEQVGRLLRARITDAGNGFDASDAMESGGLGLAGMHERLASIGGTLTIRSHPGAGTVIEAIVPLPLLQAPEWQGERLLT